MNAAFKEWRVVVDTLGRGDQVVIMRKGGIDEGENGFKIKHRRFWLFPTQFHQQKDMVISTAAEHMDPSSKNETIPIQYHCEVVDHFELTQIDQITRLRGLHVWKDDVLIQRMTSGAGNQLHALLVRVSKLPTPMEITMDDEYGGCRSWIQLKDSLNSNNTVPIMSQELCAKKIQAFKDAIS